MCSDCWIEIAAFDASRRPYLRSASSQSGSAAPSIGLAYGADSAHRFSQFARYLAASAASESRAGSRRSWLAPRS
jgi:hypothetical protein